MDTEQKKNKILIGVIIALLLVCAAIVISTLYQSSTTSDIEYELYYGDSKYGEDYVIMLIDEDLYIPEDEMVKLLNTMKKDIIKTYSKPSVSLSIFVFESLYDIYDGFYYLGAYYASYSDNIESYTTVQRNPEKKPTDDEFKIHRYYLDLATKYSDEQLKELETCKKTTLKKFDISDKEFTEIVEKMANYKKGTENIKYVN